MLYGINRQADWIRSLGFCYQNWGVDAGFLERTWKSFHKGFYRGCAFFNLGLERSITWQLMNAMIHLSLEFEAYANL